MSVPLDTGTITDVGQTDVMVRSLVIAAVIVLPYAVYKVRQVTRIRRINAEISAKEAKGAGRANHPYGDLPALEDVIADIDFVVNEAHRGGGAMLVVPHEVTVSDRPADRSIVDALVRDALRRSNLVVTAEIDAEEGRLLECVPLSTTQPRP